MFPLPLSMLLKKRKSPLPIKVEAFLHLYDMLTHFFLFNRTENNHDDESSDQQQRRRRWAGV